MGKRLGGLIRTARTDAGLTQAQLAALVNGASQSDIGRFERGEAEPTTQVVKDIAKACGVTQKSLLDAMPKSMGRTTSTTKPASASRPTSSGSSSSSTGTSMRVSATEKRLVELYRAANTETRKRAIQILKGETPTTGLEAVGMDDLLANIGNLLGDTLLKK